MWLVLLLIMLMLLMMLLRRWWREKVACCLPHLCRRVLTIKSRYRGCERWDMSGRSYATGGHLLERPWWGRLVLDGDGGIRHCNRCPLQFKG